MRPLELRLKNFRSYRGDEHIFDFRDRRLVGIVGPIGAGKSTILDAVSFALYGRTPAAGTQIRSLLHQREDGGYVSLRFAVDGEVWESVRAIKRGTTPAQHALFHYATDTDDADEIEKLTGKAEVDGRIVDLLGLEFDAFGRSVLLAQGRFAEFLQTTTTERDKVLKGVFGHDRIDAMKEVAKARLQHATIDIDKLAIRAEQVDRTAARLAGNKVALLEVAERIEALEKAEPELRDLERQIDAATVRITASRERLEQLRALARRMPDPAGTDELLGRARSAARRRAELGSQLAEAQKTLKAAEAAKAEADVAGTDQVLRDAQRAVDAIAADERSLIDAKKRQQDASQREANAAATLDRARARVAAAVEAMGKAGKAASGATEAVRAAEAALHDARHGDMASTLRGGLVTGEPCPVCTQPVDVVPDIAGAPDVARAERELAAARKAEVAADAGLMEATAEHQAATELVASGERELSLYAEQAASTGTGVADLEASIKAQQVALVEVLGAGDPEKLIAQRRKTLTDVVTAVESAARIVGERHHQLDEAIANEQETKKRLSELQGVLVEMSTRLDLDIDTSSDEPDDIAAALGELRTGWNGATENLKAMITAGEQEVRTATESLEAVTSRLGLEDDLTSTLARARATRDLLRTEVERDEKEVNAAAHLIEERDQATERRDVYARLASDLTDSKFLQYLLDDERARLGELGSNHFQRLSAGRYRFSEDAKFDIIDLTAADAVRDAKSLSGGETFLASLALALSLAEMVTRTGGRLDAFFLDEGFGSLDPEHLDLAMDGIEALVADDADRLVVVVSHVPELRQRVEDLIVLDKDATTGDTRVVRA